MDILNIFYNNPLKPVFIKKILENLDLKKIIKFGIVKVKLILNMEQKLKDEFSFDNELPGGLKNFTSLSDRN